MELKFEFDEIPEKNYYELRDYIQKHIDYAVQKYQREDKEQKDKLKLEKLKDRLADQYQKDLKVWLSNEANEPEYTINKIETYKKPGFQVKVRIVDIHGYFPEYFYFSWNASVSEQLEKMEKGNNYLSSKYENYGPRHASYEKAKIWLQNQINGPKKATFDFNLKELERISD